MLNWKQETVGKLWNGFLYKISCSRWISIVYKAIWLDGCIDDWISEKQHWKRYLDELKDEDYESSKQENIKSPLNENEKNGWHVVLKSLNNSSNINDDFLNEVNNLKID